MCTLSRSRLSRPASMKGVSVAKSLKGAPRLAVRYSVTVFRMATNSGDCCTLSATSSEAGPAKNWACIRHLIGQSLPDLTQIKNGTLMPGNTPASCHACWHPVQVSIAWNQCAGRIRKQTSCMLRTLMTSQICTARRFTRHCRDIYSMRRKQHRGTGSCHPSKPAGSCAIVSGHSCRHRLPAHASAY